MTPVDVELGEKRGKTRCCLSSNAYCRGKASERNLTFFGLGCGPTVAAGVDVDVLDDWAEVLDLCVVDGGRWVMGGGRGVCARLYSGGQRRHHDVRVSVYSVAWWMGTAGKRSVHGARVCVPEGIGARCSCCSNCRRCCAGVVDPGHPPS